MNQADFNKQAERSLPPETDPTLENSLGWKYAAGQGPSRQQALEDQRLEQEIRLEQSERQKLDSLAKRKEMSWRRRSMLQRGRRY